MKYKNLHALQKIFQSKIIYKSDKKMLFEMVLDKKPIPISKRVGIYEEAYRARLTTSLKDDFQRVVEFLGNNGFLKLAEDYIYAVPSIFSNLAEYSEGFVFYIKDHSYNEVFKAAIMDWLEILSSRSVSEHSISINIFESLDNRTLKINSSANAFLFYETWIVGFKKNEKIYFIEMNSFEYEFLNHFCKPQSVDHVDKMIDQCSIDESLALKSIEQWLRMGLIYCY